MIIAIIALLIIAIIIGVVLIAEWSYIAVKEFEYEQQAKRKTW